MVPRQLSSLSRLSALSSPAASQLLCPANSHSRPLTTSGYGEISGPRILCLVSRQNRQRNRLLWRATHIVLHHVFRLSQMSAKLLYLFDIISSTNDDKNTFHQRFSINPSAKSAIIGFNMFIFKILSAGKLKTPCQHHILWHEQLLQATYTWIKV